MGLLSPAWQDKDTNRALAAVAALDSDSALLRAAKGAREESVAFFAVSRIKDELLLERLALDEPRISAGVAGKALSCIADYPQEFKAILQRLEYEASQGDAARVAALFSAALDVTEDHAAFAKMLATLEQKARNEYLKRCAKDEDFLAIVLLQCVGIFSRSAPEVSAMLWRFSDKMILNTLKMLDDMGVTLSDAVAPLVKGLRSEDAVLEAVSAAKAVRARMMALDRIDEKKVLLSIALHNDSATIRQAAAGRLTERADIIEFISAHPYDVTEALLQKAIRPALIERKGGKKAKTPANIPLTALSQDQLLEVAIESRDYKARQKAISMLAAPSDLNLYARRHMSELDEKTVLRLTSEPLLAELACDRHRYRQSIRMAAVSRLTSDERLGQVIWEHTKQTPTADGRELVAAALPKIRNQDIIYQAMGLADGLETYISADVLNYITDTAILLRIALGGSRFAVAAAERIADAAALERIIQQTDARSDVHEAAAKELENLRIAALVALDEGDLKEVALHDSSLRVRVAAVARIDDQDFLESLILDDESDIRTAAVGRLRRWAPLLALVRDGRVSMETILARLSNDVFLADREAIITAAVPGVRSGDADKVPRYATVITKLTGKDMDDVYIEYGGMEYIKQQIDKVLNCSELRDFRKARDFLCYAYGKSQDCHNTLKQLGSRTLLKHHDFDPGCASERCDVTVETVFDFEH